MNRVNLVRFEGVGSGAMTLMPFLTQKTYTAIYLLLLTAKRKNEDAFLI